uniref:ATP-dependent DNA helicase n=1 Tax=Caenorhabditis japonica TaxID=281687 RepID=A0A8R1I5E7_CAEJA
MGTIFKHVFGSTKLNRSQEELNQGVQIAVCNSLATTPKESAIRKKKDRESRRLRRADSTEKEKMMERISNSQSKLKKRLFETQERAEERRASLQSNSKAKRASETKEQHAERFTYHSTRYRNKKDEKNATTAKDAFEGSNETKKLKEMDVIIWDECSMISKTALQTADFKFSLLDNMRIINGDANWIKFLLDVGDGVANYYEDRVTLLEGLPVLEDLVDDVFGGSNKGKDTFVPRITCYEDKNLPFHLKRTQFPVKLAFAISINKAQGQSFGRVGLYLPEDFFARGQTYVALSRARSKNELLIKYTSERLLNVVYKEIL